MLEDEDSFDSDLDVDQDIRHPKVIKGYSSLICRYKIETELDRKFLMGVLVRDCHFEQGATRGSDNRHGLSITEIHQS